MSRYDLSRASDVVLFAAVRAALGSPWEFCTCVPHSATTRRALEAFAAALVDEPAEDFRELRVLRTECRVKTRAEYDREIGQMMRDSAAIDAAAVYSTGCVMVRSLDCNRLSKLIEASRSAPEGEP